jgi:HPt (histidine-containing phosphotransfer) domain-containing protein
MITWSRVDELAEEIGPDDFAEVVALFLEEVEGELENMNRTDDPPALDRSLHFLKGSALNLGFSDFAALCQQGETRAARGETAAIGLGTVRDCYAQSKITFLDGLKGRHPI